MTEHIHKVPVGEGFALIDACDSYLVRQYRWHPGGTDNAYAQAKIDGKTVYLHRLIMAPGPGEMVDHVNGDRLDCRRRNLRIASPSENCANRSITTNPTGFKGVVVHKTGRKFQARCERDGGVFRGPFRQTAEQAADDYDRLARGVFGDFATFNFPRKGERGVDRPGGVA
ncbi:MAG: HNH endonuclease signature motif containing protein [Alphaproteobacteria bacterium]